MRGAGKEAAMEVNGRGEVGCKSFRKVGSCELPESSVQTCGAGHQTLKVSCQRWDGVQVNEVRVKVSETHSRRSMNGGLFLRNKLITRD